jgi:Response receiver domain
MSYQDKALGIIKESIKSAIFIDEKAKEFYSDSVVASEIKEENLSVNLYNNFKSEGISLSIHKFLKSNLEDSNIKDYLFKNRDLILLDWELDDVSGEEYSLRLLSDIIRVCSITQF